MVLYYADMQVISNYHTTVSLLYISHTNKILTPMVAQYQPILTVIIQYCNRNQMIGK